MSPLADRSETRGPNWVRPLSRGYRLRAQFADDGQRRLAPRHIEAAGARHIAPPGLVFAIAVEHLHAMVIPVGDIDQAVVVDQAMLCTRLEHDQGRSPARPTRT